MSNFSHYLIDLLSQFAGGRGELGNELVRFGLGMFFWGILLVAAKIRRRSFTARRERLLIGGFAVGFIREGLMFVVFSLRILGYVDFTKLHAFFPPAEHTLQLISVVVVSAAFLQYILDDRLLAMRYMKISLVSAAICYLTTFLWWASFISEHPTSRFGQVWCDWVLHILACILIGYAFIRVVKQPGWIAAVVALALLLFFLDDLIKIVDIALQEQHEDILAPIRHSFHLLAILLLGYIYWQEQLLDRRRLEKQALEISDLEKRQLGRDLHDGLVQQLTGINFFMELMSKKIEEHRLPEFKDCQEVTAHLQDAITHARAISRGLYPIELERSGLRTAIEELIQVDSRLYNIACSFSCSSEIDHYNIETATHIYRILQESISNAARHANAKQINVDVYSHAHQIVFEIQDDGSGFEVRQALEGMGMQTMRYRASLIKAALTIEKGIENGTCVRLVCPLNQRSNVNHREGEYK